MQAAADFSYSLGTFIAAGIPAPSAWRLSSKIVNDDCFKRAAKKLEPTFERGEEPAKELKQFKCIPADFRAFYLNGTENGKLDSNLIRAGGQYQEKANHAMSVAAMVYPSLVFAIIIGFVISAIFQVYGGYLKIFDQF